MSLIIQGVTAILKGTPAVTKCYRNAIRFSPSKKRRVEAEVTGAEVTSDGGALLLAKADRRLGLTCAVARAIGDDRRRKSVVHSTLSILRQRVYALALGHEDLNDHGSLRRDTALRAAAGRDAALASPSTLCRFERRSSPSEAMAVHEALFKQFVEAHRRAPKRVVLDFDATDIALHGMQEGRHWHGHCRNYCHLPLYVFCGRHLREAELPDDEPSVRLLAAVPQPSDRDAAWRAGAVLKLLVQALRKQWPGVGIVFRGDGGFCRPRILRWCEKSGVGYVVGLPTNSRVASLAEPAVDAAAALHRLDGEKVRLREAELPDDEPSVRLLMSRSHLNRALYRRVAAALAAQPPWSPLSAVPGGSAKHGGWGHCARSAPNGLEHGAGNARLARERQKT